MDYSVEDLAQDVLSAVSDGRYLLGIAGCGGSGKSTFAADLAPAINQHRKPSGDMPYSVVMPMDGFHYSNAYLVEHGLAARKGAPPTFDVPAFLDALQQLRTQPPRTVRVPAYDRDVHEPVADAITVDPRTRVVLVEGNYLLLNEPPWQAVRPLLDAVWFVDTPIDVSMERIRQRHIDVGRTPSQADQRIERNDLPNAELIWSTRHRADRLIPVPAMQNSK